MFVYLSKILPPLVYPLGLACLLIVVALILRRPRLRTALLGLALALLLIGGNRWVALGLARSLEWRYIPAGELPQAQAIVVLGGGTLSAQYPRQTVEVDQAGDRLIYAAQLYHQGKAEHLLLSGGRIDWISSGAPPAEDMASLLEMLGVPPQALWLESQSRNTYENARNARAFLEPLGIRRILLVTSASHMPRSVALFEKQGFEVIPAPADFSVTQEGWEQLKSGGLGSQLYSLLPSAESLSLTTRMLKEYVGMLIYRLSGWM
jgi:uncharacterized SAM-binding protein YcdF (DUF218 family)